MNLGLATTFPKLRRVSPRCAVCFSLDRVGSLKKKRTAKNMRKTLAAETRNTFSTLRFLWTQEATKGPSAPPIGTSGSTDDAGFDEGDADCGKHQDRSNKHDQRNRVADRGEPRGAERAEEEIGAC